MKLPLFYDSYCPLCMLEMHKLAQLDAKYLIHFVDINPPLLEQNYLGLKWQTLNRRIRGQLTDSSIIRGLDVTCFTWDLVGKGWVYAPFRWFADAFYLLFVRYPISLLLTGKKRGNPCEKGLKNE